MKKGILLFVVLLGSLGSMAQEQDSAVVVKRKPLEPALYLDYGKLLTYNSKFEQKLEMGFEVVALEKWQFIAEFGKGTLNPAGAIENGEYTSEGSYKRFGMGFIPYRQSDSRLGIGFRSASASFEDRGYYTILSPSELQEDVEVPFDRRNLTAKWFELMLYSDKAMNSWLTLGFQFRVRFMQEYDSQEPVNVYAIPGYGRAEDKSIPALNLFLKIEPF